MSMKIMKKVTREQFMSIVTDVKGSTTRPIEGYKLAVMQYLTAHGNVFAQACYQAVDSGKCKVTYQVRKELSV